MPGSLCRVHAAEYSEVLLSLLSLSAPALFLVVCMYFCWLDCKLQGETAGIATVHLSVHMRRA